MNVLLITGNTVDQSRSSRYLAQVHARERKLKSSCRLGNKGTLPRHCDERCGERERERVNIIFVDFLNITFLANARSEQKKRS